MRQRGYLSLFIYIVIVHEHLKQLPLFSFVFWCRNSAGHVYLCFDSISAAMAAQRALHGRWFAGKMITATYMVSLCMETSSSNNRVC